MGISAPAVGIHGTPDPASIGYSVSHGCIRMLIPEVEWLFKQVEVGTPVYIVQMIGRSCAWAARSPPSRSSRRCSAC